jgi:hypothetical protein
MIFDADAIQQMQGEFNLYLPAPPAGVAGTQATAGGTPAGLAVGSTLPLEVQQTTTLITPPATIFGVNCISSGNTYGYNGYTDAQLAQLLPRLQAQGFGYASFRCIWQVVEPKPGDYTGGGLVNNLIRIAKACHAAGIKFCFDFHTLFQDDVQSWQCPRWLTSLGAPANHLKHIFSTPAVLQAFIAMQVAVAKQLAPYASALMIMNEPFLWPVNADALSAGLRAIAKAHKDAGHGVPVTARLLPQYSPWGTDAGKPIDIATLADLDIVGMNVGYADPADHPGGEWAILKRALAFARSMGKPMWITEGGISCNDPAKRAGWFAAQAKLYRDIYQPDVVLRWNVQNDAAYFAAGGAATYNFLGAQNSLAADILGVSPLALGDTQSRTSTSTAVRQLGVATVLACAQMPLGRALLNDGGWHWCRPADPDCIVKRLQRPDWTPGFDDVVTVLRLQRQT